MHIECTYVVIRRKFAYQMVSFQCPYGVIPVLDTGIQLSYFNKNTAF
ncbi:hypothetical protein [Wolbachia endosymbiont (group A) of Anomoia purmunda]|nr:hypothetical protein [Wolbachia endosymbiont (group A) of Anomoia purmunda]